MTKRKDVRTPFAIWLALGAGAAIVAAGCHRTQPGGATVRTVSPGGRVTTGPGNVPGSQEGSPLVPNPKMTPGATLPVTAKDICVPGYTQKVRNVPSSLKNQVYAQYGIASRRPGQYEVDHLISLELGGSNSIKNLWPESYVTQPWNAHVKDQLENALHDDICAGRISLPQAQKEIATDWIAAYEKHFHTNAPLASAGRVRLPRAAPATDDNNTIATGGGPSVRTAALTTPAAGAPGGAGQVWVNLNSGKYFGPDSSHYGRTKRGQYMSEADAVRQGYVAAQGN